MSRNFYCVYWYDRGLESIYWHLLRYWILIVGFCFHRFSFKLVLWWEAQMSLFTIYGGWMELMTRKVILLIPCLITGRWVASELCYEELSGAYLGWASVWQSIVTSVDGGAPTSWFGTQIIGETVNSKKIVLQVLARWKLSTFYFIIQQKKKILSAGLMRKWLELLDSTSDLIKFRFIFLCKKLRFSPHIT